MSSTESSVEMIGLKVAHGGIAKPAPPQIAALLYWQAELLDTQRWEEFIELFTGDGVYWMPASPAQHTWEGEPAIFAENRDLMRVRAKRLMHPRAWSRQAPVGMSHTLSSIVVEQEDASGRLTVRTRFHVDELRGDEQRFYAGTYRHILVPRDAGYQIELQRVDLLTAQVPFDLVLQTWI